MAFLLCLNHAIAQSKFSASLKLFLASEEKDKHFRELRNNQEYIPLFIEVNEQTDFDDLIKRGVVIRTITGPIATADIPLDRLYEIESLSKVKRLELPLLIRRNNDSLMKVYTTVDKVHAGLAPLNVPYTGKGVMIGLIDDGIEFGHPEFLDSNRKTTVDAIWNMESYHGKPPPGYNYGTLWERDTLNSILNSGYSTMPQLQMQNRFGYAFHGTSVAALAAGKNGVAPDASIVAVAFTAYLDTLLRSDKVIDAIAFIYQRAKAAEKKCIINISLGTQWGGPHDGKTMVERAIDYFSQEKSDLLVCTSAGNNGNDWKHWGGFPIRADSSFGFAQVAYAGALYFTIPKNKSSELFVSFTDTRSRLFSNQSAIGRDSILYQTPYVRIDSIIQSATPIEFTSYLKNGERSAAIRFTASHYNDDYDELIVSLNEFTSVPPNFDWHIFRFIFKGSGTVHGYFPFFNLHPVFFFGQNPYPRDSTYHSTDSEYSSAIPTNAYSVLSSGAYNIRNCYVSREFGVQSAYASCQLTYFTSHGPTLDGRIKPDILSPGENVISAWSRWNTFDKYPFVLDSNYMMFAGTSASSPITAGIAALIWERFPSFSRDQIIDRIKSTARRDNFTAASGALPNNVAGWGKADAFKALTDISTDLTSVCNQILICTTAVQPTPLPTPETVFHIYPNPSKGNVIIEYRSVAPIQLSIYNILGQLLQVITLPASPSLVKMDSWWGHLPSGLYYIHGRGRAYLHMTKLIIAR